MRIVVLIVGLLGSGGAATLGTIGFLAAAATDAAFKNMTGQTPTDMVTNGVGLDNKIDYYHLQEAMNDYHWAKTCIWFLFASALLGLIGAVLGLLRQRTAAAVLLLAAFVAPMVFVPSTAIFTFFLAPAGLLALFIKPRVQPV